MSMPIPGFDGYRATSDGQITGPGKTKCLKQRLVDGYPHVTVNRYVNGRKIRGKQSVHRLVCLAFHGCPLLPQDQVRHLNGIRSDCRAENLCWGTSRDNAKDAIRHGTLGPGLLSRHRKLTLGNVHDIIRRLKAGESDREVAQRYGVSRYYPSQILQGRRWQFIESPQGGRKSL